MSSSSGTVVFDDAKLQAVDVVATGNVGIGSTNPRAPLDINDTGAMIVPVGTTAEQPATAYTGMLRFNTSLYRLELYNGSGWISVADASSVSGGTTTTVGNYKIHTFLNSSDTLTVHADISVEYLVVAGGGGGGGGSGGAGGGGGGVLYGTETLTPGAYTITVGAGGSINNNGSDSSFNSHTAIGGGYGSYQNQNPPTGGSGGSGGGGSGGGGAGTYTTGGTGTSGQGNNGGRGYKKDYQDGGGGGGGAGQSGSDGGSNFGGNGGDGVEWPSGSGTYYGGGGGGSSYTNTTLSSGGNGGGGDGGRGWYLTNYPATSGTPGTDGTGGGGGGGETGAVGGDGIVIIRYLV